MDKETGTISKKVEEFLQVFKKGEEHRLDEFLGACEFHIGAPTLGEIRMALKNIEERSLLITSG